MMKIFFKNNWILLLIVLQPILDIISYFQTLYFDTSYTWVIRILLLVIIVIYSFYQSSNKKKYIFSCLPIVLFYLFHILNLYRINNLNFITDTKYYVQVFQFPILTISFISIVKNDTKKLDIIKKGIVISFLTIFISVIISLVTNSYQTTYSNYGILGWFSSANTQSMILCALASLCIGIIYNKKNILYNISICIISFILLFFNATRSCYYSLLFIYFVMMFISLLNLKKDKINKVNIIVYLFFLIITLIMYNSSYTFLRINDMNDLEDNNQVYIENIIKNEDVINNKNLSEREKQILILKSSYIYEEIIEIHGEDVVYEVMKDKINQTTLSDNRLRKRINAKIEFNKSDIVTKIFGIGYSVIEKNSLNLENDITAIFYYYGFFGLFIYIIFILYFLLKAAFRFIFDLDKIYDAEYIILIFTILLLLFGGEYSGAFLRKPNANIYYSLIFTLLYFNTNFYKKINNNKICFLCLHLGYGGIETATINSANSLSKFYNVEIISFYNLKNNQSNRLSSDVKVKYLYDAEPNRDIFIKCLKNHNFFKMFKEGIKSLDILIKKKILIIKCIVNNDSFAIVSTRQEFSTLLSKYGRDDVIKIAQEHQHHDNNEKYIKKIRNKYNNIDYLCALSKSLKNDYEGFLGVRSKTKVVLLPNMLESKGDEISKLNKKNLISVGRLEPGKRIDEIIKIFKEIEVKQSKLFIIGSGSEENNLRKLVDELKLNARVEFLGYLSKEEQEKYYLNSSVFLMTSETEGLPMVLLEAMQYGVPCIAYETDSGVCDIINNKNGYVISNRNRNEFIKKVNKILDDKKLRMNMQEEALKTADKFKSDNVLKIWLEILK